MICDRSIGRLVAEIDSSIRVELRLLRLLLLAATTVEALLQVMDLCSGDLRRKVGCL